MFGRFLKSLGLESTAKPVDIDELISTLGQASATWEAQQVFPELIRARLADTCRDASIRPVSAGEFSELWKPLDEAYQRRFGLLLAAGDVEAVQRRFAQLASRKNGQNVLLALYHLLVTTLPLLTVDVVAQSDVRLEELARHFCAQLGLPIEGESAEQSAARLHEIDFGRLTQEADAARASAEERMAFLRKLQEEQEQTRRPRRGKW